MTTDPKSPLPELMPDAELESRAEAIAGRPDDHKDAIVLLAIDYAAPYRSHIAALEAKAAEAYNLGRLDESMTTRLYFEREAIARQERDAVRRETEALK